MRMFGIVLAVLILTAIGAAEARTDIYPSCNVVQLTHDKYRDAAFQNPSWNSKDGRIYFDSDRSGFWALWSMNPDGTDILRVHPFDDMTSFALSSDGTKLAYSDFAGNLYISNIDGSDQKVLVQGSEHSAADNYWEHITNGDATWSPDGAKIAFTRMDETISRSNTDIYVINVDGTNMVRLTTEKTEDRGPAWSPDGKKIAFQSTRSGQSEIWIMDSDGSNPTQLTVGNNDGDSRGVLSGKPAWSPDSTKIAFYGNLDGRPTAIWVMNADGSDQKLLIKNQQQNAFPTWSPDGKKIVFKWSNTPLEDQEISVVTVGDACKGTPPSVPSSIASLSDYPDFFRSNPPVVVVGDTAPGADVVASVNILQALEREGIKNPKAARLTSEIYDVTQLNAILIGSPCYNSITHGLLGGTPNCDLIPAGKGLVKLYKNPQGTYTLILAAKGAEITQLAQIVAGWNHPNINAYQVVSDTEVWIPLGQTTPPPAPTVPPQRCTDSDGGKNYAKKGTTYGIGPFISDPNYDGSPIERIDYCDGSDELVEYFCADQKNMDYERKNCAQGCRKGRCVEESPSVPPPREIVPPPILCNGCETSQGCIPFGVGLVTDRTPAYCDLDKTIKPRKPTGELCQNSFECSSNSCMGSTCRSVDERLEAIEKELKEQRSLLQRITDFFSKLFGFQ